MKPGEQVYYYPAEMDIDCPDKGPYIAWIVSQAEDKSLTLKVLTAGDGFPVRFKVPYYTNSLDYLHYWTEYEKNERK